MTDLDRLGPDHDAVVRSITEAFPDADIVTAMGATFFSLDPEKHWPNFATIVTTDEHDMGSPSNLTARPGRVPTQHRPEPPDLRPARRRRHGPRLRGPRPPPPPPRLRPAALGLDPEPERRDVRDGRQATAHRERTSGSPRRGRGTRPPAEPQPQARSIASTIACQSILAPAFAGSSQVSRASPR